MGRYYKMSKKISKEQKKETLRELYELENVKKADIDLTEGRLLMETADQVYCDVMTAAVNIFNHAADGCELEFCGFAYTE